MGPFRHCHRNALKGLRGPSSLWFPAASIPNRRFRCLASPRALRFSLSRAYPENRTPSSQTSSKPALGLSSFHSFDQVLDRLVSPGSKPYGSSTGDLSPGSLPGVLLLSNGTLLLEVGFTLRCLQRLSRPHFASLLCRWHDNSCTSDASTPVLSY